MFTILCAPCAGDPERATYATCYTPQFPTNVPPKFHAQWTMARIQRFWSNRLFKSNTCVYPPMDHGLGIQFWPNGAVHWRTVEGILPDYSIPRCPEEAGSRSCATYTMYSSEAWQRITTYVGMWYEFWRDASFRLLGPDTISGVENGISPGAPTNYPMQWLFGGKWISLCFFL